jgi:type I restriction enzyme, S subunit
MKGTWRQQRLGDVLRLEYGKPLDSSERKADGLYPVYGANGEKARSDKYLVNQTSIIVGRKGSVGETALTEERFWPLDVTYFVKYNDKQHNLRFLYYLLGTLDLPSLANGVKPGLNRNQAYSLSVNVPPLKEQQRLVCVLDKALGDIAVTKVDAESQIVNCRELFESVLDQIFERGDSDWRPVPLGELCEILDSRRQPITKRHRVAGKYPYYGATGILDFVNGFIFDENLVLVGEDGAKWGRGESTAFLASGKYWVNNHAHVLRPNRKRVFDDWIIHYINHIDLTDSISGMTVPKLNQGRLRAIPIPVPPLREQQRILAKVSAAEAGARRLLDSVGQRLTSILELERSFLNAAFDGEL